jgi:hypothetical protein
MSMIDHYKAIIEVQKKTIVEKDEIIRSLETKLETTLSENDKINFEKQEKIAQLYQEIIDLKNLSGASTSTQALM